MTGYYKTYPARFLSSDELDLRNDLNTMYNNDKSFMTYNKVLDSGERQEFSTGSVRDTQSGKGRFDLLPFHALTRLAQHFENGAVKYGDNNWRRGQNTRRYMSSAFRHLTKYMLKQKDEDHLAAALWNIACLIETEYMIEIGELPKELDDINER